MTRFEILQRFASDKRTHRDHAFTFMVLSEMWVSEGKPESFAPATNELVRILKARPRNVYRWLSELDKYGFIGYRRGRNQHEISTIVFNVGGIPNVAAGTPNGIATMVGIPAESNVPVSQMAQHGPNDMADSQVPIGKTSILASEGHNVDKPISAETFLVHNNNHLIKDLIINSKGKVSGDHDGKRVQGKNQTAPKLNRRQSAKSTGCKFVDSPFADIVKFREAFGTDSTAQAADLDHYHARLLNWRDKKGKEPERTDWLATAKTFMLNDYREGKLVTVTNNVKTLHNATPRNYSRSAVIEPESTTGRRFGSW